MNRWFRLPGKGDGSDEDSFRPALEEYDIRGWVGAGEHPDGAPQWVARVYADEATLDSLGREQRVAPLRSVPTKVLNQIFDTKRTADEWERVLRIGPPNQ